MFSTMGLSRRDGTIGQSIANSGAGVSVHKKQPKDLPLAQNVSQAGEGGIWDQDQKHDEADGKPLKKSRADDVSKRVGQCPAMN